MMLIVLLILAQPSWVIFWLVSEARAASSQFDAISFVVATISSEAVATERACSPVIFPPSLISTVVSLI